ncbi:hypothetical protein DFP72DRAFT_875687 [Ephemerocybe angulata]|uniref:Uncharacterized protein n=1 Tax=Ephemerocybe angulata TaxID=980116 RepID=A0A8H6IGL4_9AGAR|nr:hypothetical protein DFP72DRAFT_875687 [Tulosesus angulatus]
MHSTKHGRVACTGPVPGRYIYWRIHPVPSPTFIPNPCPSAFISLRDPHRCYVSRLPRPCCPSALTRSRTNQPIPYRPTTSPYRSLSPSCRASCEPHGCLDGWVVSATSRLIDRVVVQTAPDVWRWNLRLFSTFLPPFGNSMRGGREAIGA